VIGTDRFLRGGASECVRYRPALLDLLEDPLGFELSGTARAHLDTCATCRDELADLVLMSFAVGRSLAEARAARPPDDAWPRLKGRLSRQRRSETAGRASSPVLGLVLAAGIAVALLVPLGRPVASSQLIHEAGVNPAAVRAADHRDEEYEARSLRATVRAGKEITQDIDRSRSRADLIRYESAPDPQWRSGPEPIDRVRATAL
jgi:hypothetical protein